MADPFPRPRMMSAEQDIAFEEACQAYRDGVNVRVSLDAKDELLSSIRYSDSAGNYHRVDGPAYQSWWQHTTKPYITGYHVRGEIHRNPEEGPAVIELNPVGGITHQIYALNGKHIQWPLPDGLGRRFL